MCVCVCGVWCVCVCVCVCMCMCGKGDIPVEFIVATVDSSAANHIVEPPLHVLIMFPGIHHPPPLAGHKRQP